MHSVFNLTALSQRFDVSFWRQLMSLFVVALLLSVVFDTSWVFSTPIDHQVSEFIYRAGGGQFAWKENFWLETVFHQWAKIPPILLTLSALLLWIASYWVKSFVSWRWSLAYVFLASALAVGVIAWLKASTDKACPWHLVQYGGEYAFRRLFEGGISRGLQCWPAGHASTGFGLLAWSIMFYQRKRFRLGTTAFFIAMLCGNILGVSQVLRGAHFISHQLWTALICWTVCWLVYRVFQPLESITRVRQIERREPTRTRVSLSVDTQVNKREAQETGHL